MPVFFFFFVKSTGISHEWSPHLQVLLFNEVLFCWLFRENTTELLFQANNVLVFWKTRILTKWNTTKACFFDAPRQSPFYNTSDAHIYLVSSSPWCLKLITDRGLPESQHQVLKTSNTPRQTGSLCSLRSPWPRPPKRPFSLKMKESNYFFHLWWFSDFQFSTSTCIPIITERKKSVTYSFILYF